MFFSVVSHSGAARERILCICVFPIRGFPMVAAVSLCILVKASALLKLDERLLYFLKFIRVHLRQGVAPCDLVYPCVKLPVCFKDIL